MAMNDQQPPWGQKKKPSSPEDILAPIIQKIKDLSEAVSVTRGLEKILQTLEFMIDYTEFHFGTEEKHMTELGYPETENHKERHKEFVSTLNHMVEDFEEEVAED